MLDVQLLQEPLTPADEDAQYATEHPGAFLFTNQPLTCFACYSDAVEWDAQAFTCSQCAAVLYSTHLLELHLAEVHDAFFAAQVIRVEHASSSLHLTSRPDRFKQLCTMQAARGLPVFVCLVEGCPKMAVSAAHRRQHLQDAHHWPSNYDCSRLHLMVHKAEKARPEPPRHSSPATAADTAMQELGSAFSSLQSGAAGRGDRAGSSRGNSRPRGRARGRLDLS